MSGTRVAGGDGRLSADLAASLEPSLKDALNHPLRREILRVLHGGEGAVGAAEIAGALRAFSRAEVGYHLQILQRCGAVESTRSRPGPGWREHLYEPTSRENVGVAAVLRATEPFDWEHGRARAGRHSSRLLTMFRVPRPVRTIRLGLKPRTELER